jgi:hypothetical protein
VPGLWELGRSIIHYIINIKPLIGRTDCCRASVYRANFVGIGTINHSLHHQYQTFDWPHGFLQGKGLPCQVFRIIKFQMLGWKTNGINDC